MLELGTLFPSLHEIAPAAHGASNMFRRLIALVVPSLCPGYQGVPGRNGEGCVRRSITSSSDEDLTVNLLAKDDVTLVFRGEQNEADRTFSLRRDIRDVLTGLDAPGGPINVIEDALNTVLATDVQAVTDELERAVSAEASLQIARDATSDDLDSFSAAVLAKTNVATAAATADANALKSADERLKSISDTLSVISDKHTSHEGTHSDLNVKVAETLAAKVRYALHVTSGPASRRFSCLTLAYNPGCSDIDCNLIRKKNFACLTKSPPHLFA